MAFEERLDARLGDVRVHTDATAARSASALGARAYTVGTDVVFGAGQYRPGTRAGDRLLAHELVHVVQQAAGGGAIVQRQEDSNAAQPRGLTVAEHFQMTLFQHFLRWSLGSLLTTGAEPPNADTATAAVDDAYSEPGSEPEDAAALVPRVMPVDPSYGQPIGVSEGGPDYSAALAPFGQRGLHPGSGDIDVVNDLYTTTYNLLRLLPSPPAEIRKLLPADWLRKAANGMVSFNINNRLKREQATPIEAADRAFEAATGVKPTNLPSPVTIPFD